MGRPRPDGGTGAGNGNTSWGGGGNVTNLKGNGFPKGSKNDYDTQRDVNERLMHYGPVKTTVAQARGPLKGEGSVNP